MKLEALLALVALAEGIVILYLLMRRKIFVSPPSEAKDLYGNVLKMFKALKKRGASDANVMLGNLESIRDGIGSELGGIELKHNKLIQVVQGALNDQSCSIADIKNQLNAIQSLAMEKDKKLRRYEDGYDLKIQSRFLGDIFNIYDYISNKHATLVDEVDAFFVSMRSEDNKEEDLDGIRNSFKVSMNDLLLEVREDLEIMLNNNSIYKYDLSVGEPYEGKEAFAKYVRAIETDDPSNAGHIAAIKKDGFYVKKTDSEAKQIRTAEVTVYKSKENDDV